MTSKNCLELIECALEKIQSKIFINVQGDEPTINPLDIKNYKSKNKISNHVICGFDKVNKLENPKN